MKTILFSVLLCAFLGTYAVNGQVDFFNNSEETARRLDSMEGRDTPQRRENRDNNRSNNDSDRNSDSDRDPELRDRWDEMFGENMRNFREGMDKFDTSETRCLFIMVVYLATYMDLVDKTNEADDIYTRCDGYALQAMAIAAATTIMYCPESLANKTEEEQKRIWNEDLMRIMVTEGSNELIIEWKKMYKRVTGGEPRLYRENTAGLASFFHPNNIIAKLLNIQQNIEGSNCPE